MAAQTNELSSLLSRHRGALANPTDIGFCDASLGEALRSVTDGLSRVMFFVDPNLIEVDYVRCAIAGISSECAVHTYSAIQENPTETAVLTAANFLKGIHAECVVAIGGGSTLDTAKMALLLAYGGGTTKDWWPAHLTDSIDTPPFYVFPTTAGTGSEVQSHALISDDVSHRKMAVGHSCLAPTRAYLDTALLDSCPRGVMVLAGIDALSHAIEAAVTRTATSLSVAAAIDAIEVLWPALQALAAAPDDAEVKTKQHLQAGAMLAGMAIESSMLGAAHGCANPLTAMYGVAHGQAVALMLPGVIQLNETSSQCAETYRVIETRCNLGTGTFAAAVYGLIGMLGLKQSLRALAISSPNLEILASSALDQWTSSHNPVPVTKAICHQLYEQIA